MNMGKTDKLLNKIHKNMDINEIINFWSLFYESTS